MTNRNYLSLLLTAVAALSLMCAVPLTAQNEGQDMRSAPPLDPSIKTTFVHLANGAPGVLYEPVNPGPKAQIAVFVMHSANDFLTHSACTELSKRGYRVLCANDSNDKNQLFNDGILDTVLLQAKAGVNYLRKYPGVKKIVLWGHSGGGTVMAAYQNIAENGVNICQDDHKVFKCPDTLAGLPPADGVIMGDANWGLPIITLLGMNPAVGTDDAMKIDPSFDMFNPANGFDPKGSHYSPEFIKKFQAGQVKKYNAMVQLALDRWALIKAGKGHYADDEPFFIAGANFNTHTLFGADMSLMSHTEKPQQLLHPDGSITKEIVHTVRQPEFRDDRAEHTYREILKTTVHGFLTTYAMRVTDDYGYGEDDSLKGIDWTSSWSSIEGNAETITVPFLTMGMTGSYEHSMAETLYNHVKSADNTLIYVEGATHGYGTCTNCEKATGKQYGNTIKTIYDYADGWLSKPGRFM
jgi:hypothetical protein